MALGVLRSVASGVIGATRDERIRSTHIMLPLLEWFFVDAAGPHLVGRLLDAAGRRKPPTWDEQIQEVAMGAISGATLEPSQRASLEDFLASDLAWAFLVDGNREAIESLTAHIARCSGLSVQRCEDLAELLVGEFLTVLQPAVAAAVSEYRRANDAAVTRDCLHRIEAELAAPLAGATTVVTIQGDNNRVILTPAADSVSSESLKGRLHQIIELEREGLLHTSALIQLQIEIVRLELGTGS